MYTVKENTLYIIQSTACSMADCMEQVHSDTADTNAQLNYIKTYV